VPKGDYFFPWAFIFSGSDASSFRECTSLDPTIGYISRSSDNSASDNYLTATIKSNYSYYNKIMCFVFFTIYVTDTMTSTITKTSYVNIKNLIPPKKTSYISVPSDVSYIILRGGDSSVFVKCAMSSSKTSTTIEIYGSYAI
jgi:hypothetical protein